MKIVTLAVAALTLVGGSAALAQAAPAPAPLVLTSAEQADVNLSIKDGIIYTLQLQLQQLKNANQDLQRKIDAQPIEASYGTWRSGFEAKVESIKTAHKWGSDVTYDYDKLSFVRTAPAAQPTKPVAAPAKK